MADAPKYDSAYMNEILDRVGATDMRAIPGTPIVPSFHRVFTVLIDRLERIEAELERLRNEVHHPDGTSDDE